METQHDSVFKSSQSITKNRSSFANLRLALLFGGALLGSFAQAAIPEHKALTSSEVIEQATSQSADAHVITKNKDDSVRIPAPMQDIIATLTAEGACIHSDDEAGEDFALLVSGLGRENNLKKIKPGKISHDEKIARLFHNNLIEEFSTSSEGIRQDFVVPNSPKGKGKLVVELSIKNASIALDDKGAKLTLKNGRELAYHNLMVADAAGRTLPAHFAVKDKQTLRIVVDDKGAKYPVRIDPTITDADWFSLGAASMSPNSHVRSIVSDGAGNIYVGGLFTEITGIADTAYIAKWDGSNWSSLGSGMNDSIYKLLWDGSNLYAGGRFTTAGGVAANSIARWDGTNWNSLGSGLDDLVVSLLMVDNQLYVGGSFTLAGGMPANNIAKWDGTNWSAVGLGTNELVWDMAWDGANLYAGGDFTTAGGVTVNYIAKWDGENWSSLGTGMSTTSNQRYLRVTSLAWDGNNLYAGGKFSHADNVSAKNIAKWDGSNWSPLGSGLYHQTYSIYQVDNVHVLTLIDNVLYAGGSFSFAGDIAAKNIARWDGTNWNSLVSDMNGTVWTLAWDGTKLFAGASSPSYIKSWNGSDWNELNMNMNSFTSTLAWDGANLYAGGWFTTAGNVTTNFIAKWDGSNWSSLGLGLNDRVWALLWNGTELYAGGEFTTAYNTSGEVIVNHIAKWSPSTNSWSALAAGVEFSVSPFQAKVLAFVWDGTSLYVGGTFTTAGGISANRIAKWNGTNWSTLGTGMPGNTGISVGALAWDGSNLYAGGGFPTVDGVTVNNIAKWDGANWSALGTGLNSTVISLTWDGSNLYAGGTFSISGGSASDFIAQWDGSSWSALGSGINSGEVRALAWDGSNLYAGGNVRLTAGGEADHILRWDGSTWSALGSGTNDTVRALLWNGNQLYVGGSFTRAGDKNAGYVAGINLATADSLVFTDLTDVALNAVTTSETLTIAGLGVDVAISITGGEYSLNGAAFTSAPGTASNGDSLQLRTTSSAVNNTTTDVVVTVGSGGTTWQVTTLTDTVPDAFHFIDRYNVAQNTLITSNTVVITGLGASSPVSIFNIKTGMTSEYSINGGAFTSDDGFINNGDSIRVRTISGLTVINIGGVVDYWLVFEES